MTKPFHPIETIMAQVSGAEFISIDTETIPTLLGGKKNIMQGHIRKVTVGSSVMVFSLKNGGSAYENMVKRRLAKEGKDPATFVVGPRKWGKRVEGTPFVEHNGEMYLEVIFLRPGSTEYKYGVRPIDKDAIEGLNERGEVGQADLDNKVIIRTLKLDSIRRLVIDKQEYTF
jgi:hypothetical protein